VSGAARYHRAYREPLQAWLGHRNIQHTVRYTEIAPNWFKDSGGTENAPAGFPESPRGFVGAVCRSLPMCYRPQMYKRRAGFGDEIARATTILRYAPGGRFSSHVS
jgi:hypothetical protein